MHALSFPFAPLATTAPERGQQNAGLGNDDDDGFSLKQKTAPRLSCSAAAPPRGKESEWNRSFCEEGKDVSYCMGNGNGVVYSLPLRAHTFPATFPVAFPGKGY